MIVRLERGLWQGRESGIRELIGNSKDKIGSKRARKGSRRNAKRWAPGRIAGVEGNLFQEERPDLAHGGQRPVGGMECKSRKGFPQWGHSKVFLGKVGEGKGSLSGKGRGQLVSRASRRASRSGRRQEAKKPK